MMGRNNAHVNIFEGRKKEDEVCSAEGLKSTPVFRRSARKRSLPISLSSAFYTPPSSSKKPRRKTTLTSPIPGTQPTLLTLPQCVVKYFLSFLDVKTLENLSKTCSYFDQMIAGQFLTSIEFPFPVDFIREVNGTDGIDKKPLLRLNSKKTREVLKIFPDMPDSYSEPISFHNLIVDNCPHTMDYLVMSQLFLLSLHRLREVDLVPESMKQELHSNRFVGQRVMDSYMSFDSGLLRQISRLGTLKFVTRLDVLVDQTFYLEEFVTEFPNLLELGLNILTRSNLSKHSYFNEYLPRLEAVISASRAPVLKVNVVADTKRMVPKVFKSSHVEKLVVTGPCTLMVFPVMEKLRKVVVKLDTALLDTCTYWRSKEEDRDLHRGGLCCVNVGAIYENCPSIESFMGVDIGSVSQSLTFSKWNSRIKKKFYEDYLNQGGSLEMKAWVKSRWFPRRYVLPKETGHNRARVLI